MGACGEGVSAAASARGGSSFFQMVLARHTCPLAGEFVFRNGACAPHVSARGGRVRFSRWCLSTTGLLRNDAFETQSNAGSPGGNLKNKKKTISAGGFSVPIRFANRRIEDAQRNRGPGRAFESFRHMQLLMRHRTIKERGPRAVSGRAPTA
jgi:hypothetical protein